MFSLVICLLVGVRVWLPEGVSCAEVTGHLSEAGLHGFVTFTTGSSGQVHVTTRLDTQLAWTWSIRELPVDYTAMEGRCSDQALGPILVELSGPLGLLTNSTTSLTTDLVSVTGQNGLWSRSLVMESSEGARACATLMDGGNSSVKVAEAVFSGENEIEGRILFQWFGSATTTDAAIYSDLRHSSPRRRTEHNWRIYTTDFLDSEADKARSDCNSLQVILLDMTARVGPLKVGNRLLVRDPYLPPVDIASQQRNHYIVLLDNEHPDTFLVCARLWVKPPTLLKAMLNAHGVSGFLSLSQESQLTPTRALLNITRVAEPILGGFRVHALPPVSLGHPDQCRGIGEVYNPTNKPIAAEAPLPGSETQDRYAVGDVSGKLGYAAEREWDVYLPLMGKHSIAHRTLVIYKNGESGIEEPWVCSILTRYLWSHPDQKMPVISAEAIYRYPIVGRIFFQQPDPFGETTVLTEQLVYSDGTSQNTTHGHRWAVHLQPPGKDFFNWTARCVSAGSVFNPYMVNTSQSADFTVGDLSSRLEMLTIAGSKRLVQESRALFTDDRLPLGGRHSIFGKSLVIFDDHGPKARGDRLACSKITGVFRRKAVAKDWYGNGFPTSVSGKVEFLQQTDYGIADIEMNLEGLQAVSEYQIHVTPVNEMLEFPCEENTLYGVYNPYGVPKMGVTGGTPDQLRVGDLSGKFGPFEDGTSMQKKEGFNDTNLMLFGQNSILGRSLVFHSQQGKRLACSTIERGYAPSEARELRAIASFHHPLGFAHGYIRMTQLIHTDGSGSDTVLEVNVRHPGKQDKNVTYNHDWAIYVNSVGVDATVKVLNTRCTAAGYIWNPYYTQLADPLNTDLYKQECGADLPLRCYVGDLSGRLGSIDLGNGRRVFSDPNIPLEGKVSAMGKSIVILNKEHGSDKFACANIEPDFDTVKYVNIRRPPKFVVSQFLEDIRAVMGIPEWFLTIDSRKTNILYNGACIQLFVHFKGPQANKLEQDFSRLLSSGRQPEPSLFIPGYVWNSKSRPSSISYKLCTSSNKNENRYTLLTSGATPTKEAVLRIPTLLGLLTVFLRYLA